MFSDPTNLKAIESILSSKWLLIILRNSCYGNLQFVKDNYEKLKGASSIYVIIIPINIIK